MAIHCERHIGLMRKPLKKRLHRELRRLVQMYLAEDKVLQRRLAMGDWRIVVPRVPFSGAIREKNDPFGRRAVALPLLTAVACVRCFLRSEERRVGKECSSRLVAYD